MDEVRDKPSVSKMCGSQLHCRQYELSTILQETWAVPRDEDCSVGCVRVGDSDRVQLDRLEYGVNGNWHDCLSEAGAQGEY